MRWQKRWVDYTENHKTMSNDDSFRSEHMTVREACDTYGIPRGTLYRWLWQRKVTRVRLGRTVWLPRSEFERLIAEGTRTRK